MPLSNRNRPGTSPGLAYSLRYSTHLPTTMTIQPHDTIVPGTEESEEATVKGRIRGVVSDRDGYGARPPEKGALSGVVVTHDDHELLRIDADGSVRGVTERACEAQHRDLLRDIADATDTDTIECPMCEYGTSPGLDALRRGDDMTTQSPRYELTTDDGVTLATAAAPNPTKAVELYCESRGHTVESTRDGLVVTTGEGAVQTVTARPVHRGDADVVFVT